MSNKKDPKVKRDAYRYRSMGQVAKAIDCFVAYLRISPQDYIAALDLGELYMRVEQFGEACKVYAKILEYKPKDAVAASNLGGALLRAGRAEDAKALLLYALELDPKNVHARINLGGVYQALGDRKANLDNALEAVSLMPSSALAFNNLGSALSDLAMFKEAKHAYETAVMLEPNQVDALINLAGTESKLGEPARAAEMYEKVITLLPAQEKMRADAVKFYAAFEYLKQGQLQKGWDYYDGGFSLLVPLAGARSPRRTFDVPRWEGKPLQGKTLMVWREQGLGDELLFYTCLHELKDMGGQIIVECDKRLVEVLARSFPEFKVRPEAFLPQDDGKAIHSDFDFHVPVGSLMRYFRPTLESFQRSGAYIKTDPAKAAKFAERLAPYKEDYRLVGICWRSGKLDPVRNLSYTTLDEWGEVLQTPGFKFVNLQYGDCEAELQQAEEKYGVEILRWPDLNLKDDLDDVFALMRSLDAVASVQTAVLVMGGSVGVPTVGVKAGGWTNFGNTELNPWVLRSRNIHNQLEITDGVMNFAVQDLLIELIGDGDYAQLKRSNISQLVEAIEPLKLADLLLSSFQGKALVNAKSYQAAAKTLEAALGARYEAALPVAKNVTRLGLTFKGTAAQLARVGLLIGMSRQAAKNGDATIALEAYENARELSKEKAQRYLPEYAWLSFLDGQIDLAKKLSLEAAEAGNLGVLYKFHTPRVLAECGNLDGALLLAQDISQKEAVSHGVFSAVAQALFCDGEWGLAAEICNLEVSKGNPNFDFYHFLVANVMAGNPIDWDAWAESFYRLIPTGVGICSDVAITTVNKLGFDAAIRLSSLDKKFGKCNLNTYRSEALMQRHVNANYFFDESVLFELPDTQRSVKGRIYMDLGLYDLISGERQRGFSLLKKGFALQTSLPDMVALLRHLENEPSSYVKEIMLSAYRSTPYFVRNGLTCISLCSGSIQRSEKNQNPFYEDKKRRRYADLGFTMLFCN